MPLTAAGFDIVGASLFGPLPIETVHIAFNSGMTVLYGQNGVGKSKILREVTPLLQGIGPGQDNGVNSPLTCLHLRLTETKNPCRELPGVFLRLMMMSLDIVDSDLDLPVKEVFQRLVQRQLLEDGLVDDSEEYWLSAAFFEPEEIYISLFPTGSRDEPEYDVWLSTTVKGSLRADFAAYVADSSNRSTELAKFADPLHAKEAASEFVELLRGLTNPLDPWFHMDHPIAVLKTGSGIDMSWASPLASWPSTFPVPLSHIAGVGESLVDVIDCDISVEELHKNTLEILRSAALKEEGAIDLFIGDELEYSEPLQEASKEVTEQANEFLESVLPGRFSLSLDLKKPSDWFLGDTPAWVATMSGEPLLKLPLGGLSTAERRWANAAIGWGQTVLSEFMPQVLVIDEPEHGLHRRMEHILAQRLPSLNAPSDASMVLVASHAPSFLSSRAMTELVHVTRDGQGHTSAARLDLSVAGLLDEEAIRLGVHKSDLLQIMNVAVVVEGKHDEVVFSRLIKDDLAAANARIFTAGGAKNARSIAEARFLFDATDSVLLFVMDNLVQHRVEPIWRQATDAVLDGDPQRAKAILASLERQGNGGEIRWLRELGDRSIDLGRFHRIQPYGLSEPDIICYLPVGALVPGQDSWDKLWHGYTLAKDNDSQIADFKSFLIKRRAARISNKSIGEAASQMTCVPQEIQMLGMRIRELGHFGPVDTFGADRRP